MSRSRSRVLLWLAASLLTTISVEAVGQGVGPAKSVKLVFLAFNNVDVQLWIDGKRVVARRMVVPDQSMGEDLTLDAKVRRRSRIVLMFGDKRREAIVRSVTTLKTIYIEPNGPMTMSSDPPALD
jgi:hypothetical protein